MLKRFKPPRFNRPFALGAALLLLLAGIGIGIASESAYRAQKLREIGIQAAIVAESVTAPLMFDDDAGALDLANALAANPQVDAVAIYTTSGALLASYSRDTQAPLPSTIATAAPRFSGAFADVTVPARRDGETQGYVYLRFDREALWARLIRYGAIALLVVMAALVMLVAGSAHDALSRANAELQSKADALNREIEQRKEAEEALLQSRKMEAIGQLTGGVAHDFNNLLMVIGGGLRMLDKDENRRAKAMEAMKQAVDRGAGLTRQLLAFARRQSLRLETVDIDAQLNGMREMLERSLRADILLDVSVTPGLKPAKTDPGQFELAILNLAVNARDAMQKGGVLTVSAQAAGAERVEIIVQDTGTGIPPELIDRIFEPYFTTKQLGEGTGLGLSQVYGFVQQCGGDMRVESDVGVGTRMILSLPVSNEPLQVKVASAAPIASKSGKTILLVEDDDGVADTVNAMLTDLGHRPTRARSVDEALQLLKSQASFELVFSDIVMPGGRSGMDLAQELAQTRPDMPVLLTTGYSGRSERESEFKVLRKPYDIRDLQTALDDVARRSTT
jgi:signal transduction histidine kinase